MKNIRPYATYEKKEINNNIRPAQQLCERQSHLSDGDNCIFSCMFLPQIEPLAERRVASQGSLSMK